MQGFAKEFDFNESKIKQSIRKRFVAILDKNIEKNLKKLGYYEKVMRGEVKCAIFGKTITLNNISLIIPKDGEYLFICDDFKCYVEALERWT